MDELKKVQKEEFLAAFQKLWDCTKPVYMPMKLILNNNNKKKIRVFLMFLRVLKKISPKSFGPHYIQKCLFSPPMARYL